MPARTCPPWWIENNLPRKAVKEKSAEGTKHISLGCKPQVKEQYHSPALALNLNLEAEIGCQQDGNEFAPKSEKGLLAPLSEQTL
ncbi:hypothetical protein [Algoriphagus formosus]|uniref:Uncharacterized protein n=1 Tax=Algoriphagus formosus TaxID=2007308 RepID=A0A4R5VF95_9BACT|nr:hypothetical protein [Algoriphagus aquimaris]TDK51034.1 hypothetical protein E1898_00305 [Algoriphagus aquimaris]